MRWPEQLEQDRFLRRGNPGQFFLRALRTRLLVSWVDLARRMGLMACQPSTSGCGMSYLVGCAESLHGHSPSEFLVAAGLVAQAEIQCGAQDVIGADAKDIQ